MNRVYHFCGWALMALVLASCNGSRTSVFAGGGSSGGSTPDYASNAAAAKLTSSISIVGNTVAFNWIDSFPAGATYTIKAQNGDGSYSPIATVASLGGTNAQESWQGGLTGTTTYRIDATTGAVTTTIKTLSGQSTIEGGLATSPPTIVLDETEPVTGTVTLSQSDNATYPSVTWAADGTVLGTGSASVGNPFGWNVSAQTIGNHAVTATIQTSVDTAVEIGRTVAVANANIGINYYLQGSSEDIPYSSGVATVRVTATANTGVASVSATLDGTTSLGTLTAPNTCYPVRLCSAVLGGSPNAYDFFVSAPTGNHTVRITATDNSGHTASTDIVIPIVTPPVVTVTATALAGSSFYYGTLPLSGTSTSTSTGNVTTVVQIGATQIYQTTNPTYNTSIDLTSFTPGDYTVSVVATDSTGASSTKQIPITIASSSALAYSPLFQVSSSILYAGNSTEVAIRDGDILLYNIPSNQLASVSLNGGTVYALDNGMFYAKGKNSDCTTSCIYQFAASGGLLTNLSNASPFGAADAPSVVAKAGYVVWPDVLGGFYTLYNEASQTYVKIVPPAGTKSIGDVDFYVSGGVVHAFFLAIGSGANYTLYAWESDTGVATTFAAAGSNSYGVQTDGTNVLWYLDPSPSTSTSIYARTVLLSSVAGGPATTVSTSGYMIGTAATILKDNVLVWTDGNTSTHTTWALYNGAKTAITSLPSSVTYGAGGGFVVYGENGKMYSWQASTGTRKLLLDSAPVGALVTGTTVYFTHGNQPGYVYKLTLT